MTKRGPPRSGQMPDARTLHLRFSLESQDNIPTSSTEFAALFACIDAYSKAIAENEVGNLIYALDFPENLRLEMLQRVHVLIQATPAPTQVEQIERGSWNVENRRSGCGNSFHSSKYSGPHPSRSLGRQSPERFPF